MFKVILAIITALTFSFMPVHVVHADFMDIFDIAISWIGYGIQESSEDLAKEISEEISKDPAKRAELRELEAKIEPMQEEFIQRIGERLDMIAYLDEKIPIVGGLIGKGYSKWKMYWFQSDLENLSHSDLGKKLVILHENYVKNADVLMVTYREYAKEVIAGDRDNNNNTLGEISLGSLAHMFEKSESALKSVQRQL